MSTIPEQYRGSGYGTIYSDSELRQAIANVEVVNLINDDTETTPIVTSGNGDKVIIPAATKKIKIYSLYFVASSSTGITLKSGGQALSGIMPLLSFASDFTAPMPIPINTSFVINVQTDVTLNGFVIWRTE